MRKIFVTGIGTDVGKTIVSSIITEALQADYWKPIQCGDLEFTDSHKVKRLISCKKTVFHPEAYMFKTAASPHVAAEIEKKQIRLSKLKAPETNNTLVIEGAGGLLVPYNYRGDTMLDIIKENQAEVILVSRNYLGSINHTLLTLECLATHDIKIIGIIFNGPENLATEKVILNKTRVNFLGRIKEEFILNPSIIQEYAQQYIFI